MADDINMTPLLPSLTAAAQIRRVKPTDPESEQRSSEEQPRQRKKSKSDLEPKRATAAVEVDLQTAATPTAPGGTVLTDQNHGEAEPKLSQPEKTIDIRV